MLLLKLGAILATFSLYSASPVSEQVSTASSTGSNRIIHDHEPIEVSLEAAKKLLEENIASAKLMSKLPQTHQDDLNGELSLEEKRQLVHALAEFGHCKYILIQLKNGQLVTRKNGGITWESYSEKCAWTKQQEGAPKNMPGVSIKYQKSLNSWNKFVQTELLPSTKQGDHENLETIFTAIKQQIEGQSDNISSKTGLSERLDKLSASLGVQIKLIEELIAKRDNKRSVFLTQIKGLNQLYRDVVESDPTKSNSLGKLMDTIIPHVLSANGVKAESEEKREQYENAIKKGVNFSLKEIVEELEASLKLKLQKAATVVEVNRKIIKILEQTNEKLENTPNFGGVPSTGNKNEIEERKVPHQAS